MASNYVKKGPSRQHNSVTMEGRVGKDGFTARFTPQGRKVVSGSLCNNRDYVQGDSIVDVANWMDVVIWAPQGNEGGLAGMAEQYCTQGRHILVDGELRIRKNQDNKGVWYTHVEILANEIRFMDSPNGNGHAAEPEPVLADDEIPF